MGLKKLKPVTPGQRHAVLPDFSELTTDEPEKSLVVWLKPHAGRNNQGRITVRHRGGGHKRLYRLIDFYREKKGIPAKVVSIEYDPNRSAWISLLHYADGEKRYILSPVELKVGDTVVAGEDVEPKPGNALPLRKIPSGTLVHNVEFYPGSGGEDRPGRGNSGPGVEQGRGPGYPSSPFRGNPGLPSRVHGHGRSGLQPRPQEREVWEGRPAAE